MFALIGSAIDVVHALLMVAWIAGLPLLFWHRYPRLTRWYAVYAITFIILNQASKVLLGECFLTTVARWFWERGSAPSSAPGEWFTVRLSMAVFKMAPSHAAITVITEILIFIAAAGILLSLRRQRAMEGAR